MEIMEMLLIAAGFIIVLLIVVYLIRYSNKRILEELENLGQKIAVQEKNSRKNAAELNSLREIIETSEQESNEKKPESQKAQVFASAKTRR